MRRLLAFGSRGMPRTAIATFAIVLSTLVVLTMTPWTTGNTKVGVERAAGRHQVATTTTTTRSPSATTTSTFATSGLGSTSSTTIARSHGSTTTTTTATTTRSPSATTTSTTAPSVVAGCAAPSGQCLPSTPAGYQPVCLDDFTVGAPLGSWADPTGTGNAVVYTGDHGCQWTSYPDGWSSTYTNGQPGYEPSQVLSVHDGMLDFFLHNVNGLPAGANPGPILSSGSRYQTYGIYEARLRITNAMPDFYIAWLLWPQNDANWQSAESDFPEANLADSQVCFYAHYGGGGAQDSNCRTIDFTQWHTYSQVWGPGYRSYYIDGQLLGTSTSQVWSQPERWQLQTEPSGQNDGDSGHLYLDWVAVYAPG